jgi:hypothetical protein
MTEDEMGGVCSTHECVEKFVQNFGREMWMENKTPKAEV